ncbi:unnamed protein product [Caenorhabditis auriculariae]|uniref:Uncharacterized protein n=1 Tax=Caenorhabditis auriculariae TaxID=2777116 RepID=A0A8S1HB48_9PELO|nr:unnamed protein product [Caenorhabditis auriculariae]
MVAPELKLCLAWMHAEPEAASHEKPKIKRHLRGPPPVEYPQMIHLPFVTALIRLPPSISLASRTAVTCLLLPSAPPAAICLLLFSRCRVPLVLPTKSPKGRQKMKKIVLATIFVGVVLANSVSRQAAVSKAIEQTKSRQTAAQSPQRVPPRQNVRLSVDFSTTSSPGKNEGLDVDKLNRLIRTLDKTWIMPRTGAKEPVGSNFQYKKTCASIYKARHGACQQIGFGVMCFNYCHERGEKLSFKCQDASDASYCRQSGTFETFLAKYRKDGYKAKAYIHQMISRCYSTAICNTQSGILNSTIIEDEGDVVEATTKNNRLKLLTRPPGGLKLLKLKTTTTTMAPEPEPEEPEDVDELPTTPARKSKAEKNKVSLRSRPTPPLVPETPSTTAKPNIWDKFTVGQKARPTPKYIPFWQRLLSTTTGAPKEDDIDVDRETSTEITEEILIATTPAEKVDEVKEESEEEPEKEDKTEQSTQATTKVTPPIEDVVVTKQPVQKNNREKPKEKHTFRPLPVTTPPPPGPELSHQKPNDNAVDGVSGPGFWNRFQPNRWFQSIHYVTNTGK